MISSRSTRRGDDPKRAPRAVVMTMTRDERNRLPRWIDYYSGQVGSQNLIVIDDNSADGSTDDLPCTMHRLPPGPWKSKWGMARARLASGLAQGLLACYDVVIFTDVDEFLVPDPARYDGLKHYLRVRADVDVIAPVAVNLLHHPRVEPDLDPTQPLLTQRRFVKFAPVMCKPLVTRVPAQWTAGFHGIEAPFVPDPVLWMVHTKYYDVAAVRVEAERRHVLHDTEDRGGDVSAWGLDSDALISRLLTWVESADAGSVPDFDPRELDLSRIVKRRDDVTFRTIGSQLRAMDDQPLRKLPQRFRHLL